MKSTATKLISAALLSSALSLPAMAAEELTPNQNVEPLVLTQRQMDQVNAGGWVNINNAIIVSTQVAVPTAIAVTGPIICLQKCKPKVNLDVDVKAKNDFDLDLDFDLKRF